MKLKRLIVFSRQNPRLFWCRASLGLSILALLACLIATPIDLNTRSQATGQFWNLIIVCAVYAGTLLSAMVITIVRLVSLRRELNDIPRFLVPDKDDIPERVSNHITAELHRCRAIAAMAHSSDIILHPGSMSPRLNTQSPNTPLVYEDAIRLSSVYISQRAVSVQPDVSRPMGMPFAEYLFLLLEHGLFEDQSLVERVAARYERARFSGVPLSQSEFLEYSALCMDLLSCFQDSFSPAPADNFEEIMRVASSSASSASQSSTKNSAGSVIVHKID